MRKKEGFDKGHAESDAETDVDEEELFDGLDSMSED